MANNYVDFGYWEYGYAEGDIKSIQTGSGSIDCVVTVSASSSITRIAKAVINAIAIVVARGSYITNGIAFIASSAIVACNAKIIGEEWSQEQIGSESWTDVPESSDVWTDRQTGNETWL
jgi:hypothetical protein